VEESTRVISHYMEMQVNNEKKPLLMNKGEFDSLKRAININ